jgi:Domain of unknown function (DUF4258)
MKNRRLFFPLLLLVLIFLVFVIRRWNEPHRKEAFNREPVSLIYTKHALCRMECRGINKEEIREIMEKGIIHFNRSNRRDRPCPTFALQGRTGSGEKLRVIFAQCPTETKVVTCYNLEEEFECQCPGDPSSYSTPTNKKTNP